VAGRRLAVGRLKLSLAAGFHARLREEGSVNKRDPAALAIRARPALRGMGAVRNNRRRQ